MVLVGGDRSNLIFISNNKFGSKNNIITLEYKIEQIILGVLDKI